MGIMWTTSQQNVGEGVLSVLVVEPAPVTALALQVALAELVREGSVAVVHSPGDAVRHVKSSPVDLVITDLLLPTAFEGLRLCRWLRVNLSDAPILVFSAERSAESHSAAVKVGVSGYIHKSASISRFRDSVLRVLDGRATWWLGASGSSVTTSETGDGVSSTQERFSVRESEVHSLLLQRFTNAEIAAELCLAEQTVKNHVSAVLRKLGVGSRFDVASPRLTGAGGGGR